MLSFALYFYFLFSIFFTCYTCISCYILGIFRNIELEPVSSGGVVIDSEHVTSADKPHPTGITLLKSVQLPEIPFSVCHYKGSTYVGLYSNGVVKVDSKYKLDQSVFNSFDTVDSVVVHKDLVYMLVHTGSESRIVRVCDMSGKDNSTLES